MSVTFAGLKKAEPKSKKEKPLLPDPGGELSAAVIQGIEADKNEKAWVAANKQIKGTLGEAALRHLFVASHGQTGEIEDTFKVKTGQGAATISLKNAYKLPEDVAPLRKLLGDHADTFLKKSFVIQIDSESIPIEMQQNFVDRLVALADTMDAEAVLFMGEGATPIKNAITVKEVTSLSKRFHEERHALFTPEQNLKIHAVAPCTSSVRYEY